jgi:hypothetical protein
MKRKEENRSVIEPSCTFFKPNKINFLPSNQVLDRKPDRVTGYKVLIDLTSLVLINTLFHVTGLQHIPALLATAPIITDGMTRITALTAPTNDKTWACLPDLTDNTL